MTTADDGWNDPSTRDLTPEPDFRPVPRQRAKPRRSGVWVLAAVLVVAIGAGAGGWYFVNDWLAADEPDGEVPVVYAEPGPIKVRPEEPGGMDVPDRDKLVYDRIDGNEERGAVERLLPPPEMPMAKPESDLPAETVEKGPVTEEPSSPVPVTPEPSPSSVATGATEPAPPSERVVPSVEDVLSAMRPPPPIDPKAQKTPAETKLMADAAKLAVPAKTGSFLVQLAAVRSREAADAEWERLRKRHSDLLGDLDLSVMRADLGPDKGVFFRLRAGPLANEAAAQSLCQKLSERKIGCLVVRPEG
ncbi:MAG: SPOR domain-containing protein [Rhodospirillales bacterium]|jgi:cell division septation protein DedD|nr:SPOR domain-containing protein [Rhodospirillales bacterium]